MNTFGRLFGAALLGAVAATAAIVPAQAATPILIRSCTVAKPKPLSHRPSGVQINYVILGKRTASTVVFAVGYRNAEGHYLRRVSDVGNFAPGVTIDHLLNLFTDVTYSGAQTTTCVPVEVKYAGGTVWIAPSSH